MQSSRKTGLAAAAALAATTCALPPTVSSAAPTTTQVVNVVAVDANGQPANGYREIPNPGDAGDTYVVFGCEASPAAVRVGGLGAGDPHLPPPQTRSVVTAWFASG